MSTRTKDETGSGIRTHGAALTKPTESDPERERVTINKAYKMYVGGAFIRSESGRYFQVEESGAAPQNADPAIVNIPRGSRKDVRDAVLIAHNAFSGWSGKTAYNRGQILYRLAEMMQSRHGELAGSLVRSSNGGSLAEADAEVNAAIERTVYYAGFADKISSLLASHNPVAGPHFGFSVPDAMGVVSVIAPESPALLGLVSVFLPVIVSGNTCVVLASEKDPRTALVFAECLATSDLPGGVVNLLTGQATELASHMASHREVNAVSAWLASGELRAKVEELSADNVKRTTTHPPRESWDDAQGLGWIEPFLETKTIWHPMGV